MRPFDWHSDLITRDTIINRDYRNTQNVRRFFISECGKQFRFDRSFMQWMKTHQGKTMADALLEWRRRHPPHQDKRGE